MQEQCGKKQLPPDFFQVEYQPGAANQIYMINWS